MNDFVVTLPNHLKNNEEFWQLGYAPYHETYKSLAERGAYWIVNKRHKMIFLYSRDGHHRQYIDDDSFEERYHSLLLKKRAEKLFENDEVMICCKTLY